MRRLQNNEKKWTQLAALSILGTLTLWLGFRSVGVDEPFDSRRLATTTFSEQYESNHQATLALDLENAAADDSQNIMPPIFWLNNDIPDIVSPSRRAAMEEMISSLGITNAKRIVSYDEEGLLKLRDSGGLEFHSTPELSANQGERKAWWWHDEKLHHHTCSGAACLMSHLKAIKIAYEHGHELAMILEDDALLSADFQNNWSEYVKAAPLGWKILQFATTQHDVMAQGRNLHDPFISWQRYHQSTRAYLINRDGMKTLLDKLYYPTETGEGGGVWHLDGDRYMEPDDTLYSKTGDAFTSTGLWVDSMESEKIAVSDAPEEADKNWDSYSYAHVVGAMEQDGQIATKMQPFEFQESLLILQNVRISKEASIAKEIHWMLEDNDGACRFHQRCEWEVNLITTDDSLMTAFMDAASVLPSNIHFNAKVSTEAFNKFSYLRNILDKIAEYDLVLFKDNDQRISGFPWRTFIEKKGNAVVAGPLRQTAGEAVKWSIFHSKGSQHFQLHEAQKWLHLSQGRGSWTSNYLSNVVPVDVPMIEMYFNVFDGKFASYFFDQILTQEFMGQSSCWGPDLLWCAAGAEWSSHSRPGCNLVPVVSTHEDSRQIDKGKSHSDAGSKIVSYFQKHPTFGKWEKPANNWNRAIGGRGLKEVEESCLKLLKAAGQDTFDLQACAKLPQFRAD